MKADAPGKLVLSGAYAVLRGAPALVTAVDRRVFADTDREANFQSSEVLEGIKLLCANKAASAPPWYDASALRSDTEKLGLGSSAAICVASLAALIALEKKTESSTLDLSALRDELYPLARRAHQIAQGGGSGIDIAAACFGGTIAAQLSDSDLPKIHPVNLPTALCYEVLAHPGSASTAQFVRQVLSLEGTHASKFRSLMGKQSEASVLALRAAEENNAPGFVGALRGQLAALTGLGEAAGVPIVLPEVSRLNELLDGDSCLLPSGAGGGDVNLYVGPAPSSPAIREAASQMGLVSVPLSLGAPGVNVET